MPEFQDYRRLFEESPTPMFIFAVQDYSMLAVNISALAQYGYTNEEFLSLTAKDIRPLEDVPLFIKAAAALPVGYHPAGRYRHRRKDGSIFFAQVYTTRTVFLGRDSILVLAVDVNAEVQAQAELAEKAKDIDTILDSVNDGVFFLDDNWTFTYVNRECARAFLMPREQLIGRNIWDVFPDAKQLSFYKEYKKVLDEKVNVYFEQYYGTLDIWVEVNAYPFHGGVAVFFLDISERKKIELASFRDRQNLLAIINNTNDIIWSVDSSFRIMSANKAFWRRVAAIVGKTVQELRTWEYDPEIFAEWTPLFERALKGEAYTITWEEERENKISYEEVSFNPIYDPNRKVSGVSCFSRDVTAEREHVKKIEKQNMQLKEIAWMQSHVIRKHVANILGLASLLESDLASPQDLATLRCYLKRSAADLDEVIHDILSRTQTT